MANLGTLIRLEFSKAIRRPMTWILTVIFIGFMGFMYTVLAFTAFAAEQEIEGMEDFDVAMIEQQIFLPDSIHFGSSLVVGVGTVVMIVFAAGVFGSEFGWATIRTLLLMRGGRTQIVISKLVLIVAMSVLYTVLGMAIVLVGSIGSELIVGDTSNIGDQLTGSLLSTALVITLRSIVAVTVWSFIGGMLALAFSSFAIGTGITLALYFIGDLIFSLISQLGTVGEWIGRLVPTYGINGMVVLNSLSPPDYSTAEIAGMVVSLVGWSAILIGSGLYRFWKMDIIAASD